MNVRFFAGTKKQYLNIEKHNQQALYFCEDTQELFWGDLCLSDGIRVVPTIDDLPELINAADGVVYYIAKTRNAYTLSPDRTGWLQTIYAPVRDASTVAENEIYNTVTTVGAVRDIEASLRQYIDDKTINNSSSVNSISFAGTQMTEVDGIFTIDRASALSALGIKLPNVLDSGTVDVATESYVDDAIASIPKPDLTNYYTKLEADSTIAEAIAEIDISNKADIDHKHPEYLTSHQDISGKADIGHIHDDLYDARGSAEAVKNDLLNGAGSAYDTLKELGDLISTNVDTITALEKIAANKADKEHNHLEYLTSLPEHIHEEYLTELPEHTHSLGDIVDYVAPEIPSVEGLASEEYVDNAISAIEVPSLIGYATESYVDSAVASIPKTDLSNYYNKAEVVDAITSATNTKADSVLFTKNIFVNNPIGTFDLGDNLKDFTLVELFTKLLGLTDDPNENPDIPEDPEDPVIPEGIIEEIVAKNIPMYSVNSSGEVVKISYDAVIDYTSETAALLPQESGFYQIKDNSGEVLESGYQELTIDNPDVPYIIALPIGIDFNTMVTVQTYDTLEGNWKNDFLNLSSDYDEISALCGELGVDISNIDTTKYTILADLESGPSGKIHRFIITE